jgi:hypothetical protein
MRTLGLATALIGASTAAHALVQSAAALADELSQAGHSELAVAMLRDCQAVSRTLAEVADLVPGVREATAAAEQALGDDAGAQTGG